MMAAFTAVKSAISMGKEINSLGKQLGSLFDQIDNAKKTHAKKKSGNSANEEALETFIAKKQAEDMEEQLRTIVIQTRGLNAWQELVRLRAQIRVERQQAEADAKRKKAQLIENIVVWLGVAIILCLVAGLGVLIWAKSVGRV